MYGKKTRRKKVACAVGGAGKFQSGEKRNLAYEGVQINVQHRIRGKSYLPEKVSLRDDQEGRGAARVKIARAHLLL